jgi:uncharacterized protein (TIGR03435 family)
MRRVWTQIALLTTFIVGTSVVLPGQQQADQRPPTFEVASIKASDSTETSGGSVFQPNGRYMAHNVTVRDFIAEAYRVRSFQIVGTPDWTKVDRFEIVAKAQDAADSQPLPQPNGAYAPPPAPFLRLQTLLKDRFRLIVHTEQREGPAYTLVLARNDKRFGPNVSQRTVPCTAPQSTPAPREFCGGIRRISGLFTARGATMAQLASGLSAVLSRPVFDRTDIDSLVDFDLRWTPLTVATPSPNSDTQTDPETSLFTALQEQLGLKLEATKGPVDVLVIDHVERPTPD